MITKRTGKFSAAIRVCSFASGLGLLLVSVGVPVAAGNIRAPEIDGGMISTGLGLLAATVLIVRARMRSK